MIVIALVAVVVSITLTSADFLRDTIAKTEMHKLQAVCRSAQYQAQAENQQKNIFFDIEKNRYIYENRTFQLPSSLEFGFLAGSKGPPANPVNLIKNPVTFKNDCITISPRGIIGSGTVYIINMQNQSMYALSSAVSAASYLRLYRYDGHGSWLLIE
jgi:hypothetical protein